MIFVKSKQQQKFMGMVHGLNKGDIKPSDVSKSVKDVVDKTSRNLMSKILVLQNIVVYQKR